MAVREMYGPAARGRVAGEVEEQRRNGREKKGKVRKPGRKNKKGVFLFLGQLCLSGSSETFPFI